MPLVGFYSTTLNDAEHNYNIYNKELLVVIKSLENWRPYLAGSPHKIIIYTDHMNLQYWREPHKINWRIARQVLWLNEYDIKLHHIPGKTNGRADALSCLPQYDQGDHNNENVVVLPDELFNCLSRPDDEEEQDEECLQWWIDPHNLRKEGGVWQRNGRRVIMGDVQYWWQLIAAHHNPPSTATQGFHVLLISCQISTGGQGCRMRSGNTCKDVGNANETKSIPTKPMQLYIPFFPHQTHYLLKQ